MIKLNTLSKICISICLSAFVAGNAYSDDGLLLTCDRWDGEQEFQIYINETEGFVLYNAQLHDSYERELEASVIGGKEGETKLIDLGLEISLNTDRLIWARDDSSTFIFVKDTAMYAYAFINLIFGEREITPLAGEHTGKCWANPFAKPE